MERKACRRLDQFKGEHGWFCTRRQILKSIMFSKQFTIPSFTLQAMKFGVVGGGATFVHVLAALTYNGLAGVTPLWANFFAFLTAVIVSYAGNWFWTFNGVSRHLHALPRFALLALTCFALNQSIVFGVVELLGQPLWLAMVPVVVLVPAFGFLLSRSRVFVANDLRA